MNLPNKLTIIRILLVPIMVIIPFLGIGGDVLGVPISYIIMNLIFIIASYTDHLDGKIARKNNLVTTFGKFADPLADKCLVLISFLILMVTNPQVTLGNVTLDVVPMWGVAIILLRELTVSGVRLVAAERGVVIAAGWSGKVKTFETMVALIFLFLSGLHIVIGVIGLVLMYISVLLTLYSGIVYIWNSRKIIFESI